MKNRATGQFTGNIHQNFSYFLTTCGIFSLIQLNNFEKEVTKMNYDPVTPVENIFKKDEDLLKFCDMANYPYSQPQAISGVYNIINKTGKFR